MNLVLTEKAIKLFERVTELAKERGIVDPDSAESKAIWDQALKEFGIDL